MDENRRKMIEGGAALGAFAMAGVLPAAAEVEADRRVPARPATPAPGRPGDFDFLAGDWLIRNRRRPGGAGEWDLFPGEASCWTILAGAGSVEELRIPARDFSGMGLRLLDPETRVWSDYWVNARSGVLSTPGMPGSFAQGAGLFFSDERDAKGPVLVASVWDEITPRSCRWRQLASRDQGLTWEPDWIMEWSRR